MASIFSRAPPPCEPTSAPAPFGSVGGEISTVAKPTEMRVPPTTIPSRCYRSSPPTPFPFRMERDIVTFTSQPEERGDSNAAIVQEAQRRARRRALTQCKRASAEEAQNLKDCEVGMCLFRRADIISITAQQFRRKSFQTSAPPRHSLQ